MKKKTTNIRRLTLRGWAAIDDLRRSIEKNEGNWSAIPSLIFETIELCVDKFDRGMFWLDASKLYSEVISANLPTKKFPILTSKEKGQEMPWEYEGRSWYFWLNLFSKNYGWDKETIAALDIDEAIGLYQELTIEEQLEKEWEWGLSEVSYQYNPSTKKSVFQKLPRPDWMLGIVGKPKPVKKVRILASMMPQGNIISLDEN